MRNSFVVPLVLLLAVKVEAGKKGRKSAAQLPQQVTSANTEEIGRLNSLAQTMASEHNSISTGFREYCDFFTTKFSRDLRSDEVASFTFITQFYCGLLPVMDSHSSAIEELLARSKPSVFHATNVEANAEALVSLSTQAFSVATDVQEFLINAIQAFPSLEKSFTEIGSKNSIFKLKTAALKRLFPQQKNVWINLNKVIYDFLVEMHNLEDSLKQEPEPTSTTTEPVVPELITSTTTESDVADICTSTTTEVAVDEIAEAARTTLLNAIEIKDAMGKFLVSYGQLRRLVGKDPAMNKQLDDMLAFPSVRAIAWEQYVKDLAVFTQKFENDSKK